MQNIFRSCQSSFDLVCVATEYGQTLIEEKRKSFCPFRRMDLEQIKKMIRDGFGVTSDFSKKPTIDFLIDATHPYAEVVTQNLQSAAQQMGIPYYRCLREIAEEQSCLAGYEKVIHAENTEQAIQNCCRNKRKYPFNNGKQRTCALCKNQRFCVACLST